MKRTCKKEHLLGQDPSCSLCKLLLEKSDRGRKYRSVFEEKEPDGTIIKSKNTTLVGCTSCKQGTKFKVSEEMTVSAALKLISGATPPTGWPEGWRDIEAVKTAHRMLLDACVVKCMVPSGIEWNEGRGIVMPAGGTCTTYGDHVSYLECAFTSSVLLRKTGCSLPIEWWFLESEEITNEIYKIAKVVGAFPRKYQEKMRIKGGWQLKAHALLASSFKEILFLDADCVVACDPEYLFESKDFKKHGAMFWGDNPHHWSGRVSRENAARVGMPSLEGEADFETGQFLIDKQRCEGAIRIAMHLADHADYWGGTNGSEGGVWYGDKTDFHVAFRKMEKSYFLGGPFLWDEDGGFYRHRYDNTMVFQHCCHSKGKLAGRELIPSLIGSEHMESVKDLRNGVCFLNGSVLDSLKINLPSRYFDYDDYYGGGIWNDVVVQNEYQLPDKFEKSDVVLDIGANFGAFTYAAMRRGALVVSVEPCKETFTSLQRNLGECKDRTLFYNQAAWRSDVPSGNIALYAQKAHGTRHTAGYTTLLPAGEKVGEAETVPFDEIVRRAVGEGKVEFLKLDCEGAEYPILYTSKRLHQIKEIAGEHHDDGDVSLAGDPPSGGWKYSFTKEGLREFLEEAGFTVEFVPASPVHGNFYARRK